MLMGIRVICSCMGEGLLPMPLAFRLVPGTVGLLLLLVPDEGLPAATFPVFTIGLGFDVPVNIGEDDENPLALCTDNDNGLGL